MCIDDFLYNVFLNIERVPKFDAIMTFDVNMIQLQRKGSVASTTNIGCIAAYLDYMVDR